MREAAPCMTAVKRLPAAIPRLGLMTMTFIALGAAQASAEDARKADFNFVNIVDNTTQSFASFGTMPSINSAGAVAFTATGSGFGQGVFRRQHGQIKAIAVRMNTVLSNFGDDVVINSQGVVGFDATLHGAGERAIFTSDGATTKTITDSLQQGLAGGAFLGISGLNDSGTVVFHGLRSDLRSEAIFTGNGGPLAIVSDTANSGFHSFGNAAINNAGVVTFRAFCTNRVEAILAGPGGVTDIADTGNAVFADFLDPVINNSGQVASAGFRSDGGVEVFVGNGGPVRPLTNPAANAFTFIDNVCINNAGTVAFFADEISGGQGIFLVRKNDYAPTSVIQTGDKLFGSTVTGLSLGRFSLNDRDQAVFIYTLQNGRSGIAIATHDGEDD